MRSQRSIWAFVAVILLLPFSMYGVVSWYQNNHQQLPLWKDGAAIKDFRLQNYDGRFITPKDWRGKIVVAHYFFTHCPSICPRMIYGLKRVAAYAGITNLQLVSFTVDPQRDSLRQLQAYRTRFAIGKDWQLLTGNKKELYRLARKGFVLVATDGDGGPTDFIHSEKLVLLDTHQRIRGYYKGTDEAEVGQLIKDIQKLAAED